MKLSVMALDYDGTLAIDGVMEPEVREAVAFVRSQGIIVLLITGRILEELQRVAGDLHFADGVVAENGAIVHFPGTGHTTVLAPRVPAGFVEALRDRGVAAHPGVCLVDSAASDRGAILETIRQRELPLVLAFNRGRVMTLPQGVTKATGLQAALEMLRRSSRNTLAIGDAENDHELLRIAEFGAAPAWGSPSLLAAADYVIPGEGPADVGRYIRETATRPWLPQAARPRRQLLLGHAANGREFALAARGRNMLIGGDARSGKSWIGGLLCEQLILQRYCVCVIDPEGDYRSLEALPGVTVLGGEDPPPTPRELLKAFRYPDRSVVIDLSHLPQDAKIEQVHSILAAINALRAKTGLPHRILIDEAHYFLRGRADLLDLDLHGYTLVTYDVADLPAELLRASQVLISTCMSSPDEVAALWRQFGGGAEETRIEWTSMLGRLTIGEAVALPVTQEVGPAALPFRLAQRLTPHVRHREKYVDVPVTEPRAFVFAPIGRHPARRARTLREFVAGLEEAPAASLAGYLQRSDFSAWIGGVFGDRALAEELARYEAEFRAGQRHDAIRDIAAVVRGRYDLTGVDRSVAAILQPAAVEV